MTRILLCAALIVGPIPAMANGNRGILVINWIGVIDNGEGDAWPHGPLGNLHVEAFKSQGQRVSHRVLRGPSRNEFLDGDEIYANFVVGAWPCDGRLRVKIWESDPGPFRSHDTLFDGWMYRNQTMGAGATYYAGQAANDAIRNVQRRNPSWVGQMIRRFSLRYYPKVFVSLQTR